MNYTEISKVKSITAICALLALGACGGDKSVSTVVTEDTDLLVQNAALHASSNLGVNINGIMAMADRSTVVATMNRRNTFSADRQITTATKYDSEVFDHMLPTLEGGNAVRSRNGNIITIDPDENYICQQWLADQNTLDINNCATVLSDLSVQITATTDDTGTISYHYSGQNLLSIQYAPATASYEIFLPGFNTLVKQVADITGEAEDLPDTMKGAIRISTSLDNTNAGEEAGSLSVAITQPLQIASSTDNYDFTMGKSVLFDVSSNAATGNGTLSVGINALQIAAEGVLGSVPSALTTISLPDFTLSADLERSGTEVLLSNVGMGRGPFRVAVENNEVMSIALDKFSARFNDLTREAEFLQALNLNVAFNYSQAAFGWIGDDSTMRIAASAPAGTVLTEQLNGSTKVSRGGPVSYQHAYVDGDNGTESFEQDIAFTTNQCFDDSQDNDGFELVSCD